MDSSIPSTNRFGSQSPEEVIFEETTFHPSNSSSNLSSATSPIRPSPVAKLFVNHTKKTCFIALLIPLIAIFIILVTKAFSLDNPQGADYFVRNDIRTRLDDARSAAREDHPFHQQGNQAQDPEREHESDHLSLTVLTRGKLPSSGKVATAENNDGAPTVISPQIFMLHKMAEDTVINSTRYSEFCLFDPDDRDCNGAVPICKLPDSFLNHPLLYGLTNKDGEVCGRRSGHAPVSQQNFDKFLDVLFKNTDTIVPQYSASFGKELSSSNRSTWIMRSHLRIGQPFTNFTSVSEHINEQEKNYTDWALPLQESVEDLSTATHMTYLIGSTLSNASFEDIAKSDMSYSIAAIILVFFVIWLHTSSAFLATSAMVQIVLSFPLAYIFYHFVFRQKFFSSLQIIAIFLLLGIGADDVFVFTDAGKQAAVVNGQETPLISRMSWTYRRAVKAMTVTTVTTAAAFFVTATSSIMPISTLGVWAALLILLQFFLVITIYPSATIIWHRFWRPRLFVHFFQKPPPEIAEIEINRPLWHRFLPKSKRPEVNVNSTEYRSIERFFRGPWMTFIRRIRYIIITIALALVAVSIWLATGLQPPTEQESFLPSNHPVQMANDVLREAFPEGNSDYQLRVRVTWGIRDIDRNGTSKFDLSNIGKAVMDKSFDLRSAAAQRHVLKFCDVLGSNKTLIFQNSTTDDAVNCWIRDYARWRKNFLKETQDFKDFNNSKDQVDELIQFSEFKANNGKRPYRKYVENQAIAFDKVRSRVVFTEVRFIAAVEAQVPYKTMWSVYNDWIAVVDNLNSEGPQGSNKAIATGGYPWMWQITQRTLVRSMFTGMGVMLVVAVVVLTISTMNWLVAIEATLCIAGVLVMVLGMFRLFGWELGIMESVGVVISIGYSFDYIAHIATAYVESKSKDRYERTIDALTELGISIFFGAVTTLVAGCMLFFATITFFVKFAAVMVSTVLFSLLWGLCFFPALLVTAGPSNEMGSLRPLLRRVINRKKHSQKPKEEEDIEVGIDSEMPRENEQVA